jgi:micrococcal nuclease
MPDLLRGRWTFVILAMVLVVFTLFWRGEAAEVRWVPDGDTLVLANGETVRLKGIDAPEVGRNGAPSQYYAVVARDLLQKTVHGKNVNLHEAGAERDRFGRIVARVSLPGGLGLSRFMVEQGAAFCYPHPDQHDPALMRDLLGLQRTAIRRGAGFWPRVLSVATPAEGLIGNSRSKRFHRPRCRYGKRTGGRNRGRFSSLRDAFAAGYAPCRKCTPWPAER